MTLRLFVHTDNLTLRRHPSVLADAIGVMRHGAIVEVERRPARRRDGFLWRRVVSVDEKWVAQINFDTGESYLQPEPPPQNLTDIEIEDVDDQSIIEPEPDTFQTMRVTTRILNVRRGPTLNDDIELKLSRGDIEEVYDDIQQRGEKNWVWRKLKRQNPIDGSALWAAEFNTRTHIRLMRPVDSGQGVSGRVRTEGMRFKLDGESMRFMGANLREFAYYSQNVLAHVALRHQDAQLRAIKRMGMRVVRFYAPHVEYDTVDVIPLVRAALDRLHDHNLLAIVCLNDSLADSNFFVKGDLKYHTEEFGHLNRVSYFRDGGWRENFFPFVEDVVKDLAEHPAIFAWELGNEYALIPHPGTKEDGDAFIAFAHTTAQRIRELDDTHLITIGLINTAHVTPEGVTQVEMAHRLYDTPFIDFGTVHFYQTPNKPNEQMPLEAQRSEVDLDVLKSLDKPLVVGEFGSAQGNHNRVEFTENQLTHWFEAGVAGFMQWGLSATSSDIGLGDNVWGMDAYSIHNRPIYNALFDLYKAWAQRIR